MSCSSDRGAVEFDPDLVVIPKSHYTKEIAKPPNGPYQSEVPVGRPTVKGRRRSNYWRQSFSTQEVIGGLGDEIDKR
jgi:hypothetical protein